jgi:hypothetical protein
MHSKDTYLRWVKEFRSKPIVGTHTVGELTIMCSHKNWFMTDKHGNRTEGKGKDMREGIIRAVIKYSKLI